MRSRPIFDARFLAASAAAFLCGIAAESAAEPETAQGTFASQAVTLKVKSAIAFRGKSFLSGDALIVAVSNARMHGDLRSPAGGR